MAAWRVGGMDHILAAVMVGGMVVWMAVAMVDVMA